MTLSIVVPVYRPDPVVFREAIESVLAQTDPDWELLLVADGPQPDHTDEILNALSDQRIRVERLESQQGIIAATNAGISASTGEFVSFLDNDDVLHVDAVAAVRAAYADAEAVDVVYTDEDKLDLEGRRIDPFHKPAWSPERLRAQMYIGHFAAYRRALVDELGGMRPGYDGAQDHDLALRVTERARRVAHVPRVLYHWRQGAESTALDPAAKTWAFEAGVRAVQDHLERVGLEAVAALEPSRMIITVDPALTSTPMVSVIILTGGFERTVAGETFVLVERAIRSIVGRTTYSDYEIVVVFDRNSTDELVERVVALGDGRVRVVRDDQPFSFSGANNLGVSQAMGERLVFLNDDTEIVTPDWLERMVLWMDQPDVGAVGCLLEYPDGRIQQAGVFSRRGEPFHRSCGLAAATHGYFNANLITLNSLAVTGACLGVRRDRYEAVGGYSTAFPMNFNDVDLCLKLVAKGWRTVLDNRLRVVHYETSSRPVRVDEWEVRLMEERWMSILSNDPWDNPNLDAYRVDEIPPPPALTRLRELNGWRWPTRVWPVAELAEASLATAG